MWGCDTHKSNIVYFITFLHSMSQEYQVKHEYLRNTWGNAKMRGRTTRGAAGTVKSLHQGVLSTPGLIVYIRVYCLHQGVCTRVYCPHHGLLSTKWFTVYTRVYCLHQPEGVLSTPRCIVHTRVYCPH